jgi:hypothetical protein
MMVTMMKTCGTVATVILTVSLLTTQLSRAATESSVLASLSLASQYESALGSLPDQLTSLVQANIPSSFTAVGVNSSGTGLIVYLVDPDTATEAEITSEFNSLAASVPTFTPSISYVKSANSLQSEIETATHLESPATHQNLESRGVNIVSVFPMPSGLVDVGVVNLTSASSVILDEEFGNSTLKVQNVTPVNEPTLDSSRTSDSSPFTAGDEVVGTYSGNNGSACTNGPAIFIGATSYPITAAHCWENGDQLYNASFSGVYMGDIHSRDTTNGGDDTELISGSSSGYVWTGVLGSPVQTAVNSYATNPVGYTVYNEGAYSGEVSSVVKNNYYGCIYENNVPGVSGTRQACNIVESDSSGIATQDGDSGGPVIRYVNGYMDVTGIVAAGTGNIGCQYNKPSNCQTTLYYTAMDEILITEYPGATLRTPYN